MADAQEYERWDCNVRDYTGTLNVAARNSTGTVMAEVIRKTLESSWNINHRASGACTQCLVCWEIIEPRTVLVCFHLTLSNRRVPYLSL